jgi:DNA-binding transcriptional LysR family regulator
MAITSVDPLSTDFAALRVLHLVHDRRSFTLAAEALGTQQSAVSYTIDKLRKVFDDPLFVRQSGGILPTDRCTAIVGITAGLIEDFQALVEPVAFDPAAARQRFVIACNYYERELLVPGIIHAVRAQAPGLRLDFLPSTSEGHSLLLSGAADVLIGPFLRNPAGFYTRALLQERYMCLMDPQHPQAGTSLSLSAYLQLNHITVTYGGQWRSAYLQELDRQGLSLNSVVSIPSPAGIAGIISGSDLVATVPHRLADALGRHLHRVDCPVASTFQIELIWTARQHASPMHKWMRELIAEVARHAVPG